MSEKEEKVTDIPENDTVADTDTVAETVTDNAAEAGAEDTAGGNAPETGEEPKKEKKKAKERALEAEVIKLKAEAEAAKKSASETEDRYLRILAEYDNYRKRTQKEKEGIYTDAYGDAIKAVLPVIDNLERAVNYTDGEKVVSGVKMTLTQFADVLKKLGVEEIAPEKGETFDPAFHNAVMHTEDPELGENTVSAVLQKGYKKGDTVFRYAMVSVAN